MIILGIDPGTQNLGFGVIEKNQHRVIFRDGGVIKFHNRDLQDNIKNFSSQLKQIIYDNRFDEVAMETLFFAYNPKSILKLAQFRGAILYFLLNQFANIGEYSPLEVKQSLTGNGKASKEQVNFMVKRVLNISSEIKPLDVSDALAVAITHSQRLKDRY